MKQECECCPFAFTDASEEIQNYGCLPAPYDILRMKRESGHNWACHSDESVICRGFADFAKDHYAELDLTKGGLISYSTWNDQGEEKAIQEAGGKT